MKGKKFISILISAALFFSLPCTAYAAAPIYGIPVSTGGSGHSLAVMNDGTLWGWGYNDQYQLGNVTRDSITTPVKIMDNAVSVAAGTMHSLAVRSDGSLFGWGGNTYRQLGVSRDSDTPVRIMDGVASIAANGVYSYVIKKDRTLWAFGGDEQSGEYLIGDGTASRPTPVKVMDNVVLVSAGGSNVLALKADGSLFLWGDNASGEIGDGTTTEHTTPAKVMEGVATAARGTFHTLAVKKDGSLWAWGSNYGGCLGDGTDKDSTVPVKIMDDVISVAAGTCHSLAIKKDGSLWSWGQGVSGLGGSKGYHLIPEKIMGNIVYACAKQNTNYAVKADGSLWAWGDGINLGNIYSASFPKEVMNKVKAPSVSVMPSAAKVLINGRPMTLEAYNINDNNYFKLRDIAMAISGTEKQFEVGWERAGNVISLTTNQEYTPVGGELSVSETPIRKAAVMTGLKIYLDGREIPFAAFHIGGNNYFMLRDIAEALNFNVTWDGSANTIIIDTSGVYEAEAGSETTGK